MLTRIAGGLLAGALLCTLASCGRATQSDAPPAIATSAPADLAATPAPPMPTSLTGAASIAVTEPAMNTAVEPSAAPNPQPTALPVSHAATEPPPLPAPTVRDQETLSGQIKQVSVDTLTLSGIANPILLAPATQIRILDRSASIAALQVGRTAIVQVRHNAQGQLIAQSITLGAHIPARPLPPAE